MLLRRCVTTLKTMRIHLSHKLYIPSGGGERWGETMTIIIIIIIIITNLYSAFSAGIQRRFTNHLKKNLKCENYLEIDRMG